MAEGFLTGETTDTTWIKPFGTDWKEVTYTAVDGLAVFEGCIILGTVEEAKAAKEFVKNNPGITMHGVEQFGTGIKGKQFRWKNNTIPFLIDPALPNQQRVTDAIKHWEQNTPIRFAKHDAANPAHADFVVFRSGNGCASSVGRQGGRQDVMLGSECSTGNCIHEIGHTVGLWHEQSRTDRDKFVTIRLDHVIANTRHNFSQHILDGTDLGGYDYGSIMHYPKDAFTADGEDTIIPTKPSVEIGQRKSSATATSHR
jgi:hypothetical protein